VEIAVEKRAIETGQSSAQLKEDLDLAIILFEVTRLLSEN
jgi:hypothetical protein